MGKADARKGVRWWEVMGGAGIETELDLAMRLED